MQTKYARQRQFDRLVESMVAWREAVRDEERELLREFARDMLAQVKREFGPSIPDIRIRGLVDPDASRPQKGTLTIGGKVSKSPSGTGDVIAECFSDLMYGWGVKVSRDGGEIKNGLGGFASFHNGSFACDAEQLYGSTLSLFICNGDLAANEKLYIEGDIIICTGNVALKGTLVESSLIIAGGEITNSQPNHIRKGARLFPNEKKISDILKLYDAGAEGLHVEVVEKELTVTKVDAGRPFAIAELKPGDRILRVNNQPVADLRTLNKYLCRVEVGYSGIAELTIQRGEKVETVKVALPE